MEILREARLQANQVLITSSVLQETNEHQHYDDERSRRSRGGSSQLLDKMTVEMGMMMGMRMMPGGPGCTEGQCIPCVGGGDDDQVARPGSYSAQSVPSSEALPFARSRSSCCHHYYYLSTASSSCDLYETGEEEEEDYGDVDQDQNDDDGDQEYSSSISSRKLIPNNRRRSKLPTITFSTVVTNRPTTRQMSF